MIQIDRYSSRHDTSKPGRYHHDHHHAYWSRFVNAAQVCEISGQVNSRSCQANHPGRASSAMMANLTSPRRSQQRCDGTASRESAHDLNICNTKI